MLYIPYNKVYLNNCHTSLTYIHIAQLKHVQLKARFVKFIHRALNHNISVIKGVTKYACNNPMSVCGRNWSEFVCMNRVVTESVKEIYNEWYGSVDVTEMDTVSMLNDMIDVRDGWGSCYILDTEDVFLFVF